VTSQGEATRIQGPPSSTAARATLALSKIGFSPLGLALFALLVLAPWIPPFNQEYMLRWIITGAFLAAQAVAFDFTAGFINVVPFGFAAIVGVGAYTSAICANTSPGLAFHPGLSPWVGIWIGAVAAGLVGLGLGVLTLRLRGIFAAVMSWFVGIALMGLARNMTWLTRGPSGMAPTTLFESTSNVPYLYVIVAMLLAIYVTLNLITRSYIGLAFRAMGQNYEAACASGVNPTFYRVLNFTVSSFFGGWLGGFYAHFVGSLTPVSVMDTSKTIEVLAIAYIGGRGSLWGGILVAFPMVFLMEMIRSNWTQLPGLQFVIYGVLLIVVMIYYPRGIAGIYAWLRKRLSPSPVDKPSVSVRVSP
jgi:branched-chain amino acid transport system permease protein